MFSTNFLSPDNISDLLISFSFDVNFVRHFCSINGRNKKEETRLGETRREKQITENLCPFGRMARTGRQLVGRWPRNCNHPHLTQFLSSRCHETILSTSPPCLSLFLSGYSLRLFPLLRPFARLFSLVTHRPAPGLISFHAKRMQDRVVVAGNERQYR